MVARLQTQLKIADKPKPLSPERQKLAFAISKRDDLRKRLAALEAAAATARSDEYDAQNDLERWKEYLPTAVRVEVQNRVQLAIGRPTKKIDKTSAEARKAISDLEHTITVLKSTREAMEKELGKATREFNIANGDIDDLIRKVIETAPQTERLLNDLQTSAKAYELYWRQLAVLMSLGT